MSLIDAAFNSCPSSTSNNLFKNLPSFMKFSSSIIKIGAYEMPTSSRGSFSQDIQENMARTELIQKLKRASEIMYDDYLHDEELTAFHVLDGEAFYEE
jgi:hypothetical protein